MLVVHVAVPLFLGWPAIFMILAIFTRAFPGSLMCLDMLGQVAWTLKLLAAKLASMDLRLGILLPACHGAESLVVVNFNFCWSFHCRRGGNGFCGKWPTGCK
jgi:hypothetical protein